MWAPWLVAVDASVGTATVLAGLLAWTARPDSRAGPALVGIGGLWFLGAFGYGTDMALVDLVGFPLQGWHDALLIALLLAVTPGGLRERPAQVIAAGAVASHALARAGASAAAAAARRHQLPVRRQPDHRRHRPRRLRDNGARSRASPRRPSRSRRSSSSRSAGGVRAAPPATRSRRCSVRRSRRPRS